MCGGDAALCQITLTTCCCYYYYHYYYYYYYYYIVLELLIRNVTHNPTACNNKQHSQTQNTQFATVSFLSFSFFLGLFMRTDRTGGPILTIYTSYDVFPPKDVPFGGFVDMPPHFGVISSTRTPILGAWIGVLQPNWWNRKTCIFSKLLRRLQPNFPQW